DSAADFTFRNPRSAIRIPNPLMIGLLLVSHSRALANAAVDLIRRTVSATIPIAAAGGVGEAHSEIGTDAIDIQQGIEAVAQPDGVLVLMDMGSAILSAEMASSPVLAVTETFESVLENVYGLHLRPVAALIKSLGPNAKAVQIE